MVFYEINCIWRFNIVIVCVEISLSWFSLHKMPYPFWHKRPEPQERHGCDAFFVEQFRRWKPRVSVFLYRFIFGSSCFFASRSPSLCAFLHLITHSCVCKCAYMRLPKRHWQLQIKMGGKCAALSPCNAKGVECRKSPFDLSNQAWSCCMQTFVIGGGSGGVGVVVSGLFCPSASLGCSWWSPHKDDGMEGRWTGRGRNREEEKTTQSLSVGCRFRDKGKWEDSLPLPSCS